MRGRAARVVLVLVFASAAAGAAYLAVTRTGALDAARQRQVALATAAGRADLALVELAASQRAYVAPGQGVDFWITKTDAALASARETLAGIGADALDPEAAGQAAAAASRLDDFVIVDERARAYARDGQRAAAADLIFADGFEILSSARGELASAVSIELAMTAAPVAMDRQIQLASIGALGVIAAISLLLLLRAPRTPEPLVTSLGAVDVAPSFAPASVERREERVVSDDNIGAALDASLAGLDEPQEPSVVAPVPQVPHVPRYPSVSDATPALSSVAGVCADLARLLDARDLDAVLGRAASALGAGGLIVWMADESGQSLAPALTRGYPASLLARLGRLATGNDNATAAAWRLQDAQIVEGALAVPLVTSAGCTGVLAIEFADGRERDANTQSLARIIAAQLAATVSPATAESRKAAGA